MLYNMHLKFTDSDASNCAISESSQLTKCIYHKKNNNDERKHKHHESKKHKNKNNTPKEQDVTVTIKSKNNSKYKSKHSSKSSDTSNLSISSSSSKSSSSDLKIGKKKEKYEIICEYNDVEENNFKYKKEMYEIIGIKRKIFILYKLIKMIKKSTDVINIIKYKIILEKKVVPEIIRSIRLFMYEFIRKIKFGLAFVFNAIVFTSLSTTKEKIQIGCNTFVTGIDVPSPIEMINVLSLCDETFNNHVLLLRFLKRHLLLLNLKYNTIYKNKLNQ